MVHGTTETARGRDSSVKSTYEVSWVLWDAQKFNKEIQHCSYKVMWKCVIYGGISQIWLEDTLFEEDARHTAEKKKKIWGKIINWLWMTTLNMWLILGCKNSEILAWKWYNQIHILEKSECSMENGL